MFSGFIVPYRPEGETMIRFLQPYFVVFWGIRWRLSYVDLLADDLRQVGRWYRQDMPVDLTRSIERQARQECIQPARVGRVVPVNPVPKKTRGF